MSQTLEQCSNHNSIPSWKLEYQQALAAGVSPEILLEKLEEKLSIAEYELVYQDESLSDIETVEQLAQEKTQYKERMEYLHTLMDHHKVHK